VRAARLTAATPEETAAAGEALGRTLGPGDVVALYGELGAGKTCFTQGLAGGLDVGAWATSPTFVLVNEYRGRLPVHHVDAYRLAGPVELEDLGLDEVLAADAVAFVEWADRVAAVLPESWLELVLHIRDDDTREVDVRPHGPAWATRAQELRRALERFA